MNKRFQKQLTQARRQQILDAAVQVIAEQGFQNTTIKQIAARAEVADGTIYNYFKNKDDILLAIIRQVTEVEVRDLHFAEAQQM
ncbi:MAG: helix-turn-helix transcriptional regulator, partial [Caldilineaceae bacterium]|nr:helix-turn-helix transcriptional regulator [Caldilineaceae bacterium]